MSRVKNPPKSACHLDYYVRHGLNPVRYEMSDLQRHLDRRDSLYRTLGLPARSFRGARVLEVAPGTGQNSLHVARLAPRELVLVEPNPRAIAEIEELYDTSGLTDLCPRIVGRRLQEFESADDYDIVICENWLGRSPEERRLLVKLGDLTARSGLLVVTAVSPVGILPNVLRKALACRIDRPLASFEERTDIMLRAFGPHLAVIPAMTRSPRDWVQDNVMNPAYLGVVLSVDMLLEELGDRFDVLGSSPRFTRDWRWFKSLSGPAKEFNRHFLGEYHATAHNFLDYQCEPTPGDAGRNRALERAVWGVIDAVGELEAAAEGGDDLAPSCRGILGRLGPVRLGIEACNPGLLPALDELTDLFGRDHFTPDEVGAMNHFSGWFGRETLYLALERIR